MNQYDDFTYYSYHHFENAQNIGCIDIQSSYNIGNMADEFLEKLWKYLKYPFNMTRGNSPLEVNFNNDTRVIGFSEIRVVGNDLVKYAAPDLILHYIINLNYCPPQNFIDAVLYGIDPDSQQYKNYIEKYDLEHLWGEDNRTIEISDNITRRIKAKDKSVLDMLQTNNSMINLVTKEGSLLNVAIKAKDIYIVKELLNAGIDVNKFSGIELCTAISEGEIEIAELLLSKNITLNLSSPKLNPLFLAIRKGNVKLVRMLKSYGIDVKISYTNEFMRNMDAITFAKQCGQNEIADLLVC